MHGYLSSQRNRLLSPATRDVVRAEFVVLGSGGDDGHRGDIAVAGEGKGVFQNHLNQVHVDWLAVEVCESGDSNQGSLELSNVGGDSGCHVFDDLIRNLDSFLRCLLSQNRNTGFKLGSLNVSD